MHRFIRFAAAAVAIVTACTAASAQDYVVRHVDVVYADLDLSQPDGRAALQMRIDTAAAMACGGSAVFVDGYRDAPRFHKMAFERCRTEARDQAVTFLSRRGVRVAAAP